MKGYIHHKTNELVFEEDAESYALDHLGLKIKPVGANATYTQDQIDFLGEFTSWYFSGDWDLEDIDEEDEDEPNLEKELFEIEMKYEDSLNRKWGLL